MSKSAGSSFLSASPQLPEPAQGPPQHAAARSDSTWIGANFMLAMRVGAHARWLTARPCLPKPAEASPRQRCRCGGFALLLLIEQRLLLQDLLLELLLLPLQCCSRGCCCSSSSSSSWWLDGVGAKLGLAVREAAGARGLLAASGLPELADCSPQRRSSWGTSHRGRSRNSTYLLLAVSKGASAFGLPARSREPELAECSSRCRAISRSLESCCGGEQ
mmetsp:Transcript_81926/g.171413  ORF Transcript_81926/g.171413 Transcript_81926/m.171413 type:complete len:218 (+) Transcript_81926:746-1399(+)